MTFDEISTTIETLEAKRYDAMLAGDLTTLSNLLAEDMVFIHPSGKKDSKKSYFKLLQNGQLVYHNVQRSKAKHLQIDDRIVFITGKMKADITWFGKSKKLESTYMLSWIREQETWRLLTWQTTGLAN
jgi:ketosteroid isomerase-like protein